MNGIIERARAAMLLTAVLVVSGALCPSPVRALDAPILMRESDGRSVVPGQQGCPLEPNLTGECANLRYYNLCSGYIWIYAWGAAGDGLGTRFDDPCVTAGNKIDKAITYFRNTAPGYNQTVDVYLDADLESDGCPEGVVASALDLDPGLRWNCTAFDGLCIPGGVSALILRTQTDGGTAPSFVTDAEGPCDAVGTPHSYYYGINGSACLPWALLSPTDRNDNFLYWLIVDGPCASNSNEATHWGRLKGLFR